MLQIRSYYNNHLIINVIFLRLGVKAGKDSLPFAMYARHEHYLTGGSPE